MASNSHDTPLTLSLQSLPPAQAKLCLFVEKALANLPLDRPLRFLLALSGGIDSTALAVIFAVLAKRHSHTLLAATINHGLRPEAHKEVAGTVRLCQRLGIICRSLACDVAGFAQQQKIGLEEAARTLRYKLLEEERQAVHADFIVTAHHADDLQEDMLMRLVRGCGWPALGGMSAKDEQRKLLRPLLGLKKRALKDLLCALNLSWFEDASNTDLTFTRNRFRHTILPLLTQENPNLCQNLAHLHRQAEYDTDFWQKHLAEALARFGYLENVDCEQKTVEIRFGKELLRFLHPAARLRLYRKTLTRMANLSQGLGKTGAEACASQLFALEACVARGLGGKTILFPGNIRASFHKGSLAFYAKR
ncbi:MAG: tRNA lysidine(34) synthetase TilS [Desulfovibrio sp.]|nr:tRNA lysidine(34) synthetase TilS [Desulfovibrio sp.]